MSVLSTHRELSSADEPLRPYQEDAVKRILSVLAPGNAVMLAMTTGAGKTRIMAEVCIERGMGKTLLLAPGEETVRQAVDALERHYLPSHDARANRWPAEPVGWWSPMASVMVSTGATAYNRLLKHNQQWPNIDVLLIDEAHHAADPKQLSGVGVHVGDAGEPNNLILLARAAKERGIPVLGVTATPYRVEKKRGFSATWTHLVQDFQWSWAALAYHNYLAPCEVLQRSAREQIVGVGRNSTGTEYNTRETEDANQGNPLYTRGGVEWYLSLIHI